MMSLYDVAWGNGTFVAGGAKSLYTMQIPIGRALLYSLNGFTWQTAPSTLAPNGWALWNGIPVGGVTYGAGRFVVVQLQDGSWGQWSANGSEWFAAWSSSPAGADVAYGNGTFVSVGPDYYGFSNPAGGSSAMVAVSPDGHNWRTLPAPTTNYLNGITFGEGRFVAVGQSGCILVSTNGLDWRQAESGTDVWLSRVGHGNGRYVATGEAGTILVSADGLDWAKVVSGTDQRLSGVDFGGGHYVAVGAKGTILTSTNATTWTPRPSGTHNNLFGVTYGRDTFIVVGAHGTILQSGTEPFLLRFDRVRAHPTGLETHLVGEQGRSFRIEASTNLLNWSEVGVVDQIKDGMVYLDTIPPMLPRKFYRAVAP